MAPDITTVQRLVGTWSVAAPALGDATGTMTVAPTLSGTHFLQHTTIPVPGAPEAFGVLGVDQVRGSLVQHYFDDRGVSRLYLMTLDDTGWTLARDAPDVTELPFRQRFAATWADDGDTLQGRWERTDPGPDGDWMVDFDLVYRRR